MRSRFGHDHIASHLRALLCLEPELTRLEAWGQELGERLAHGQRLLAAGNGGSAAQAQHLTSELVGRYRSERQPLSAIALHAETSSLTAISNDYGFEQAFAREVQAHGRPGDVLITLSTSGRSENLVRAARAARRLGIETWALTGPGPNHLQCACASSLTVQEPNSAAVQEIHLVAIHLLCQAIDRTLVDVRQPALREAVG
jgi:D-sedoheptulose 7-phosphate isomerase